MWLIVGLGNPGRGYADHRHNIGFMVIDELAGKLGAESFRSKFSGQFAKGQVTSSAKGNAREDVTLLKPETFMNASGDAVQPAMAFLKVPPQQLLVVHDELDIPFAELRLKQGGGHGGHNGLRSIIQRVGSPDFARLRVGIGRPPADFRGEIADYVLSPFAADQRTLLPKLLKEAVDSAIGCALLGVAAAQMTRNVRKRPE